LVELLPGGECSIDDVCRVLGMSRRTLQRKLKEENTSFQQQLNHTRELLTKNYLRNTRLSSEDIAGLEFVLPRVQLVDGEEHHGV